MWLTITLIIRTLVLLQEVLKILQTYKSCFYNYCISKGCTQKQRRLNRISVLNFLHFSIVKGVWGSSRVNKNWARNIFKSKNWTKRKATTGKLEPSKKFLEEEKFTYQKKISNVILGNIQQVRSLKIPEFSVPSLPPCLSLFVFDPPIPEGTFLLVRTHPFPSNFYTCKIQRKEISNEYQYFQFNSTCL